MPKLWSQNTNFNSKGPETLGEIFDFKSEAEMPKTNLEHPVLTDVQEDTDDNFIYPKDSLLKDSLKDSGALTIVERES